MLKLLTRFTSNSFQQSQLNFSFSLQFRFFLFLACSRRSGGGGGGGGGGGESEAPLSLFSSLFFLALFLRAVLHYPKAQNRRFFSLYSFWLITLLPRFASSQSVNFNCLNNNTFLTYQIPIADMEKKSFKNFKR